MGGNPTPLWATFGCPERLFCFTGVVAVAKVDHYIYKNQKKLRCGYTTGSCAAAAAKAAVRMLLTGEEVRQVKLETPKGILL